MNLWPCKTAILSVNKCIIHFLYYVFLVAYNNEPVLDQRWAYVCDGGSALVQRWLIDYVCNCQVVTVIVAFSECL